MPDSAVTPRGALQITSRDKEHVAKPSRAARRFRIMSTLLVPDDLWEAVEPRLPKEPAKPKDGRARIPDRAAFVVIDFVLGTGCPWRSLPKELGCGSGVTCWRRLRDWQEAGVWQRLPERLLNWLGDEAAIHWSRASVDSLSVRAKRGHRWVVGRAQFLVAARLPPTRRAPRTARRPTSVAAPPGLRPDLRALSPSARRLSAARHRPYHLPALLKRCGRCRWRRPVSQPPPRPCSERWHAD